MALKNSYAFFQWQELAEVKSAVLTISRPDAMNALNGKVLDELSQILDEIAERKDLRSIILTGEGKAFVAGADISEMSSLAQDEGTDFAAKGQSVFRQLEKLPQVTIAAVNGFALGGGMELALACDVRIASGKAVFGQPEVNLGLIPGFGGTQRLPRVVGMGWAKYLILSGEQIDASRAQEIGLVLEVLESEKLMDRCQELAKVFSRKGPNALAKAKESVESSFAQNLEAGLAGEAGYFGALFPYESGEPGNEVVEGTRAFLEKRKADFADPK
jgi:enoyl-CoA hydratase